MLYVVVVKYLEYLKSRQVCIRKWQLIIAVFGNYYFRKLSALPHLAAFNLMSAWCERSTLQQKKKEI